MQYFNKINRKTIIKVNNFLCHKFLLILGNHFLTIKVTKKVIDKSYRCLYSLRKSFLHFFWQTYGYKNS